MLTAGTPSTSSKSKQTPATGQPTKEAGYYRVTDANYNTRARNHSTELSQERSVNRRENTRFIEKSPQKVGKAITEQSPVAVKGQMITRQGFHKYIPESASQDFA